MFDTLSELAAEWILPTVFFWFVLCVLATNIQEWVAARVFGRVYLLDRAVNKLLGDDKLKEKFYQSPLIQTKAVARKSVSSKVLQPEYIDPQLFAKVILGWVMESGHKEGQEKTFSTPLQIHRNVRKMRETHAHLAGILEILLSEFRQKDLSYHEVFIGLQTSIENWFRSAMEEATRVYRRRTQQTLLVIGLIIATLVNFDPVFLTTQLWSSTPSEGATSTLAVGWRLRALAELQEGECQSFPRQTQTFGIPLSLYKLCISPASATSNTTLLSKLAGFLIGAFLIRIGAGYVHDLWKNKVGH